MGLVSFVAACWALVRVQYLALVSVVIRLPVPPSSSRLLTSASDAKGNLTPWLKNASSPAPAPTSGSISATSFIDGVDGHNHRHHHDVDLAYRYASSSGKASYIYPYVGTGAVGLTYTNGTGTSTSLYRPRSVTGDASGNLYILESDGVVKYVEFSSWKVSTLFQRGTTNLYWDGGNNFADASPRSMVYDQVNSVLYVGDTYNDRVKKFSISGSTLTAGSNWVVYAGGGSNSGSTSSDLAATSIFMRYPTGVALDSSQNLYICDYYYYVIRKVTRSTGKASIVAGIYNSAGYSADSTAAISSKLNLPMSITLDSSDNLYILDSAYNVVRKVSSSDGIMTIFAGKFNVRCGTTTGCGDDGPATSATLAFDTNFGFHPSLGVDSSDNVYVSDSQGASVRVISSSVR